MNTYETQKWEKPTLFSLDVTLTMDAATCADKGKLGTSLDGITGSNNTVNCGS